MEPQIGVKSNNCKSLERLDNLWLKLLARFGYITKGLVYLILGLLSLQIAFGYGAKTDTTGVLTVIAAQPFGKWLLIVITVGLIGYVVWRCLQVVFAVNDAAQSSGLFQRIGYGASALSYTGLTLTAVRLLLDLGKGSNQSPQDWTALLLDQPFGQWLVGLVGFVVVSIGISFVYRSRYQEFEQHLKIIPEEYAGAKWAVQIGRFGIAARGLVFSLIGLFIMRAALQFDPQEAHGLDGALRTLAGQPFGKFWLVIVALGFSAYGVHMFVEARYRRMLALQKPLES